MDEERERLLDRIQKLMAMANSNSPNEAEVAARKMRELMDEYSITIDEIGEIKSGKANVQGLLFDLNEITNEYWAFILASACADFCDCKAIRSRRHSGDKLIIVGFDADREAVLKIWTWLFMNIQQEIIMQSVKRSVGAMGMREATQFGMGAAEELQRRLRAVKRERNAATQTQVTALVVVKSAEVNKFVQEEFNLTNSSFNFNRGKGYGAGAEFGSKVSLADTARLR